MRLIHFLNEDISEQQIFDTIQKDCKPFLKQLKGADNLMFRGSNKKNPDIIKLKPRKDRRSVDTDPKVQILFDDIFKKKFGWKPRSEGVFCTGNFISANYYGALNTVWPIGSFKYLWSLEVSDLFSITTETADGETLSTPERYEYWSNNKKEIEKAVDKYTDGSLARGIISKKEIMIGCKSYYMVKHEHTEALRKMFL